MGWTYAHNRGRVALEGRFRGLVDASTYIESVDDGEFEVSQPSKGATLLSGTPVHETVADGPNGTLIRRNWYHAAFEKLKEFCDEDFDLIFTTSCALADGQLGRGARLSPTTVYIIVRVPHLPFSPLLALVVRSWIHVADHRRFRRLHALPAGCRRQPPHYPFCACHRPPDQ